MIAWDTETRSFRWWEKGCAFLVSWDVGEGGEVLPLKPYGPGDTPIPFLQHEEHVGANMKFDAHQMREATGWDLYDQVPAEKVHDVLMRHRLVYGNRRPHDLKNIAEREHPGAKNAEREMEAAYEALTGRSDMAHDDSYYVTWCEYPEIVEHYAKMDASMTLEQEAILRPMIEEDPKLHELYKLEQRVSEVLYRAEQTGVAVDPRAVSRLDSHYREREAQARNDLEATLGGVPEGSGSEEWLRERLIDVGVPLDEKTRTGKVAVNKQALQPYADHPAVKALFDWRRVRKFQSTYIDAFIDRDVVHGTANQAEAWTGRMSYRNPNMQNLPKRSETAEENELKVRSVIVPRPGCEFLIFDYDAIEMRILAHFLGIPEYQEEVASGDPHAKTAFAAMGVLGLTDGLTFEDFGKNTPNRGIRDGAKQVTYSIVYGGGGPVVRDTWNREMGKVNRFDLMIDLDQARQIRKAITGAIPGFKHLTDTPWKGKRYPSGVIHQQLTRSMLFEDTEDGRKAYGYVRTIGGRKQWISLEKAYVGLSGLVQGSAADVMKYGAVNVYEALKGTGAQPLLFVHDELVVECEKGQAKDLYPIVEEAMVSTYDIKPTLEVEGHITDVSYAHVS